MLGRAGGRRRAELNFSITVDIAGPGTEDADNLDLAIVLGTKRSFTEPAAPPTQTHSTSLLEDAPAGRLQEGRRCRFGSGVRVGRCRCPVGEQR